MPLSLETGYGDFWSGLKDAVLGTATQVYRAVNPFVDQQGSVTNLSNVKNIGDALTRIYEGVNPGVNQGGSLAYTSIMDVPVIGGLLTITQDTGIVNWDTNASPQMRVIVPIAASVGAGLLTAGIGAAIGGAIAGGVVGTTAGVVAGAAAGGSVGGYIGQYIGRSIADNQIEQYISRVKTNELSTQLNTLKADSASLQAAIDATNESGYTDATDALSIIKDKIDKAIKAINAKGLIVPGLIAGGSAAVIALT